MKADRKLVVVLLMSIVLISATTIIVIRSTSNASPSGPTLTRTTASQLPLISPPAGANLTMTSIDVGQGDALLLTFPHNESMLIDGGKENQGATVVAYLNSTGITHLNGVVATHPDSDHIGGLLAVLKAVPVDHVYDLGLPKTSDVYAEFLQLIAQKNVSYSKSRAGDTIAVDPDTTVSVINPLPSTPATDAPDNDHSIVIKATYHRISYLLTGDAESPAEARMISLYNVSSYVLKVGHHGSRAASSAAFLKAVMPRVAVISVGANNSYGHPAPQVLARLAAVNATIYRTDTQGSVMVTTNGQTVDVRTARNT
ncbi:MAG: ComEC/Rec2 family competence protein [Halobacteriota archaeon]